MTALARMLATVGGLGDCLPAPGTSVGSPVGLLLFVLAWRLIPGDHLATAMIGLVVLTGVAVWASGIEARRRGEQDPGAVVIDEVAGQWATLAVMAVSTAAAAPRDYALSFVLFRMFDIIKPWPVSWLERLPGGWGIVADDIAAGLLAGLVALGVLALLR